MLLQRSSMYPIKAFIVLVLKAVLINGAFSTDGCGEERSCWFQPPGCQVTHIDTCTGSVKWTIHEDGIQFQLETTTTDLDPNKAAYVALGISKDMHMGDDSVVECIIGMDGIGRAYVSFNDETNNKQLLQASEVMLENVHSFLEDNYMTCNVKWLFDGRENVDESDRFKVFDLTSQSWHLLFAKGSANKRSLEKEIHSVNDGALFPWIAVEQIQFCGDNCSVLNDAGYVIISDMKQTDVSRYWRYRFAVIHGIFMVFTWWVFISSAVLLARFFKPLWPRQRLLGTAVWFQLHRDFAIAAVFLHVIGVFLIIYQAGRLYKCSYECNLDDWAKKMHVITGLAATALIIVQLLIAIIRPGPNSRFRPIFNWTHWFVGMSAWTFATVTIFLAVPLGKTGLLRVYGHSLTWLFGAYVIVFLISNVTLEILSYNSERRSEKIGSSSMVMGIMNGPTSESPIAKATFPLLRLTIFFAHGLVALGTAITVAATLVKILLSHSP